MDVIGQTIDDAVGEAFDKSAKILGLSYPGGPFIDKYAQLGNKKAFIFPQPKTKNKLDFSFSGLKTSILYFIKKKVKEDPNFIKENLNDICASVQGTIISILMKKLIEASKQTNIKIIAIAGGVSANTGLRKTLKDFEKKYDWKTYIPKLEYTTDNAAMIGIVGYYKYLNHQFEDISTTATARMIL
jgi:N6-L-threonylcarbamoyladenine synthase